MANCQGVSKTPTEILRPIHRYPARLKNGKLHYSAGLAICPDCDRPVATRPNKDDITILCGHGPAPQKFDERRRAYGTRARAFNGFVGAPPIAPYAGIVRQVVTIASTGTASYYGGGSMTQWRVRGGGNGGNEAYHARYEPIAVNYTSQTVTGGNYVIEVNQTPYYTTTGTVSFLTDAYTWSRWNNQYTLSVNAYATNGQIWSNWTGNVRPYTVADVNREVARRGLTYARPVETPEEREARRQAEALALFQRVEAERLASQSASERALGTLLSLLTPEQRDEYARKDYFHVVGSKGRLYRIHKGSSGNIRRVVSRDDEGRGEAAFCVHSVSRVSTHMEEFGLTPGHLPHEDHMIQQMLHLQIDEEEILAKANVHWGTREPTDAELERFFAAEEANQRDRERQGLLAL